MKVKKFVAPSMPEAMKMIRSELGQDAVILNSKVVQKGGIFGFFAKKNIEVIAAIDPQPVKSNKPIQKIERQIVEEPKEYPKNQSSEKVNPDLLKEIKELKLMMNKFSSEKKEGFDNLPLPIKEASQVLIDQEINVEYREELLPHLLEKWYINKGASSKNDILMWIKELMTEQINGYSYGPFEYQRKYLNVVGPTGVGKTTTLAKIAAESVIKHKKKVAFITTDTYRIAAIDQLKTYAKILEVPVEVAYNFEDFKEAKKKFEEYDLVLIDTAGRNFRNKKYIEDLNKIIDFDQEMETFLVMALTSKFTDMVSILNQFSLIKINKFIFTKVDETATYGSMFNLIKKYNIGVAYLTNGQNVPDDILEATPSLIINTILGVDKHE